MLLLLCVLLCACVLLALCMRTINAHKLPPACYGSLPIIGITHLLLTENTKLWHLAIFIAKDAIKKGGVVSTRTGIDLVYLITDPEDAMTVANSCLDKHYIYRFMEGVLGKGLATAPVSIWHRHRKLLNPAYSLPVIHGYLEIFNRQSEKLVSEMGALAGKGPFLASSYVHKISIETSCLTTFGTTCLDDADFFKEYIRSVDQHSELAIQRFFNFWLHSDLIYKMTGLQKKQEKLASVYRELTNRIINKTTTALKNQENYRNLIDNPTGASSFLELILPLRENNSLTEQELREELDTTVGAAFETTSIQLQATLFLIGSHQNEQKRMFEEIMTIVGPERDVQKEDLQKLVYTETVIKESVRLFPTLPIVSRTVKHDVKLKNYTLRAGSHCGLLLYGINRDTVWGPDAEQFRPERWLEPDSLPNTATAFAGFSLGKRSCIGKTYAMTSLKVSLVHLVRKYRVMADYTKLQFKVDIMLKAAKGHEISLLKRS